VDKNREFVRMGGVEVSGRTFDEHMILEKQDRSLMMLVRTDYGIGVSYSYDRGHTWTEGKDSGLQGPSSRFFIKRLKSGRVLLVNHYHFQNRNNLTALLSEDDGQTFPYSLLLDERDSVAYPDGVEADDGYLYITYDRERGDSKRNIAEVKNSAREILFAKFTEEDILAGELVNKGSKLKQICSKLVGFPENCNPFEEFDYFSDLELVEILCKSEPNEIIAKLFNAYPISCVNMGQLDSEKLDSLIENMQKDQQANVQTTLEMIRLIRSVSVKDTKIMPIVETVKAIIEDNFKEELSVSAVAKRVNVSKYYLMHAFKKQTGITLGEYRAALRLTHAKQLLIGTKKAVGEIASECGFFDANYFSKVFKKAEKISPMQFRNLHKK
jgi:AraC-like DNA-binding protein